MNAMKQNINYQKWLEQQLEFLTSQQESPKRLFLHSCCAPCSSYVLEYLSAYFEICVFYFNPNISPEAEYRNRAEEQKRLISSMKFLNPVSFLAGEYCQERFYEMAKGHETDKEGGERCFLCYEMRLREAAGMAKKKGFDFFTTTLSISPLKNAGKLNEIGARLEQEYGIPYLYADFKKKNGYKRSIELSKEYDLYRQDFCGCVFSRPKSF